MPFALLSSVWLLQVVRILDISFCSPCFSRMVDISRPSSVLQCLPISRLPIFLNHLLQNFYAQLALLFLAKPARIIPPLAAFFLLPFLPPGVILPEQTPDAYMLAYADGYTLNFLLAAAFPFAQSLAIYFQPFLAIFGLPDFTSPPFLKPGTSPLKIFNPAFPRSKYDSPALFSLSVILSKIFFFLSFKVVLASVDFDSLGFFISFIP